VAYSPVADIVAVGGTDNTVKLWDVAQGEVARTLAGHGDDVRTIAFSPDGQVLASGTGGWDDPGESVIRLWRVSDGALLDTFSGHGDWVEKVAFSPDGTLLTSCGRDGVYPHVNARIKFWRVADGALLAYHDEQAMDLAFSPEGRQFCYGGGDGSLTLAGNPADSFETHLFYQGHASPGGPVEVLFMGPPQASPVFLWYSPGVLALPLPTSWGSWYLEFPAFGPTALAPIPAGGLLSISGTLPAAPPGPYDLALQAFIGNELSTLCLLAVE
jgi:WD40 repeat protein